MAGVSLLLLRSTALHSTERIINDATGHRSFRMTPHYEDGWRFVGPLIIVFDQTLDDENHRACGCPRNGSPAHRSTGRYILHLPTVTTVILSKSRRSVKGTNQISRVTTIILRTHQKDCYKISVISTYVRIDHPGGTSYASPHITSSSLWTYSTLTLEDA